MIKFQFFISILTCGMNSLQRYIIHVLETRVPWAIHSDLGGFNCIVCLGDFLNCFLIWPYHQPTTLLHPKITYFKHFNPGSVICRLKHKHLFQLCGDRKEFRNSALWRSLLTAHARSKPFASGQCGPGSIPCQSRSWSDPNNSSKHTKWVHVPPSCRL